MDTFSLQVLSPAGLIFQGEVTAVTLPTAEGEVGILSGHIGYIALLGTGALEAALATGGAQKLVISGGFSNFAKGKLTILADTVDRPGEWPIIEAHNEGVALEKTLETLSMYEPEWEFKKSRLQRIQALESLV